MERIAGVSLGLAGHRGVSSFLGINVTTAAAEQNPLSQRERGKGVWAACCLFVRKERRDLPQGTGNRPINVRDARYVTSIQINSRELCLRSICLRCSGRLRCVRDICHQQVLSVSRLIPNASHVSTNQPHSIPIVYGDHPTARSVKPDVCGDHHVFRSIHLTEIGSLARHQHHTKKNTAYSHALRDPLSHILPIGIFLRALCVLAAIPFLLNS